MISCNKNNYNYNVVGNSESEDEEEENFSEKQIEEEIKMTLKTTLSSIVMRAMKNLQHLSMKPARYLTIIIMVAEEIMPMEDEPQMSSKV